MARREQTRLPSKARWITRPSITKKWSNLAPLLICALVGRAGGGGIVLVCDEQHLLSAMSDGGTVTFACDGRIDLSATLSITKDTVLDASGRDIVLSGSNTVRVVYVAPGVNLAVTNVTISDGRDQIGGGLFNAGGTVNLVGCRFYNNQAAGTNGIDDVFTGVQGYYHGTDGGPAYGGAICSTGVLRILEAQFSTNLACGGRGGTNSKTGLGTWGGYGGGAFGGAIYSTTGFDAINVCFDSNQALGGPGGSCAINWPLPGSSSGGNGGFAQGGAIWASGSLRTTNSTFTLNTTVGGPGGNAYSPGSGGQVSGGAILNAGGALFGSNCAFTANLAVKGIDGGGRHGGASSGAMGGSICNTGAIQLVSSMFLSNGVGSGLGGAIYHGAGSAVIRSTLFQGNSVYSINDGGDFVTGGPGASCYGGSFFNGATTWFSQCSFMSNTATGGVGRYGYAAGGNGGTGGGGALWNQGVADVSGCAFIGNSASGGGGPTAQLVNGYPPANPGPGGIGEAGAIGSVGGSLRLVNSTVFANSARGGDGGSTRFEIAPDGPSVGGAPGPGYAGGLYSSNSTIAITNCTIAGNIVMGGVAGTNPVPTNTIVIGAAVTGGIAASNCTLYLQNTITTRNTDRDVDATFTGDHNLVSSDARLGMLTAEGNAPPTLPLMPDSPAIDAATPVVGFDTDQRGVRRPFGSAPDIGAYEWNGTNFYSDFVLTSVSLKIEYWEIAGAGPTNKSFRLQASSNLLDWVEVDTNSSGPVGSFRLRDILNKNRALRFYRTVSP